MATAIIDDACTQECTSRDYGDHLLSKFKEFWEGGLFCDFTLIVGNEIFRVHRAVLSGCSDYFLAMFSHGMMETTTDSLELQTVSVQGLRPLLRYAYTGKIILCLDSVSEILAVATFLQITTAIELCADFLKSVMTFENAKQLLSLADNYGLVGIKQHHEQQVLNNFMDFAETEEFLQLDPKEISNYLMNDSLKTSRESKLLTCALKWYNHDKEGREPVVHDVIDKIRFALDGWPTIELAQKQELFKSNHKCNAILQWTKQYLQEPHKRPLRQSFRTRVRNGKKTLVQIGGMKNFRPQGILGFALPGEEEDWYEREQSGCDSNFYYDRYMGYWVPLGVVAHYDCRSHCPIVQVNDLGIMVGGYLYTSDFETTFQHCSNEVKLFSPDGFSLWDMPYLNYARAHHVAVYCSDFIYAIGGKNEIGALASVERYDLEKEKWEFACPLTHGLFDHAAVGYKGKVYVTGGVKGDEIISSVLCYDPGQDQWSEMTDMLSARAYHGMAAVGNELFVCGGRPVRNSTTCLSSVESFSVEQNQWSYVTPMRQDCACMTAVVLDGQLTVVGGENSTGDLLQSVQMFDPDAKTWSNHSDLPIPLKNLGCAVLTLKTTDDRFEESGEESFGDTYDEDYVDHDGFLRDHYAFSSSEGEGSLEDLLVALRGKCLYPGSIDYASVTQINPTCECFYKMPQMRSMPSAVSTMWRPQQKEQNKDYCNSVFSGRHPAWLIENTTSKLFKTQCMSALVEWLLTWWQTTLPADGSFATMSSSRWFVCYHVNNHWRFTHVFISGFKEIAPLKRLREPSAENVRCQKCLEKGHWTYECKGKRKYLVRTSRTKDMNKRIKLEEEKQKMELLQKTASVTEKKKKQRQKNKKKHRSDESSSSSPTDSSSDSDGSSSDSDSDSSSSNSSSSSSTSDSDSDSSSGSTSSVSSGSSSSPDSSASSDSDKKRKKRKKKKNMT